MQEKECYVDNCNEECHEVIGQIKTLISEIEKYEELMKLKALSLDELLKFLKPLRKTPHIQRYKSQGTDSDIHGGTQGFRSICVFEDLVKKLQDKLAGYDYKNFGKLLIDSKTPSQNISQDQLDRIKDNEKKQKYGSSFIDRKVPSQQMSHDELEESKIMDRKNKYDKSFIDSKVPSHRRISQDQLEKTTNIDRKQKKEEVNKNNDKNNLKYEFEKKVKKNQIKEKEGEIKKSKSYKEATGLKDKNKLFKKTPGKNVIEQSKGEKKRKSKKQSDDFKENAFEVDSKKIKVRNKSLDQFEKIVLSQKKKRKCEQQYNIKKCKIPVIEELPPLPVKIFQEPATNDSGSILGSIHPDKGLAKMIQGNMIVRDKRGQSRVEPKSKKPLFYDVAHTFDEESLSDINLGSPVQPTTKSLYEKDELFGQYRLSNRNYIKNGWTVLPTSTFVRRVNVYKMVPADSKLDWRGSHINEDIIFYKTGEVLAEVYDDGLFKWFYRDGNVALDFIDVFDNETKATKEYVIYDTLTKNKGKREDRVQTLASFDEKGHGSVYDRFGRVRIKYNQGEGVLFDSHIGSPCHWKWNTLNEPPKIEVVHTSEFLTPLDTHIESLDIGVNVKKKDSLPCSQIKISSEYEDKRSEIELNNLIKDHAMKVMMNYKPFEIRSKMFKLNEHFSLRMLGQSKIYIMFRDGKISLKLNVGMKLISNEVKVIKGYITM